MQSTRRPSSFYSALLDSSSDLVTVIADDGAISFSNLASSKILGYSPEELVGREVSDFIHPDDLKSMHDTLREALSNPGQTVTSACRLRRKDGEYRLLENLSTKPVRNAVVSGVVVTSRDVTEIKQIREDYEERLLASAERLRKLIEYSPFGTALFSKQVELIVANDAFFNLLGYPGQEATHGVDWSTTVPSEWRAVSEAAYEEAKQNGRCHPFEMEFRKRDNSLVPVLVSYAIIETDGSTALFAIDITELKKAEKELERFARILESTSDAVLSLSLEGKILTWNPAAELLYGYSATEIIGRPDTDLAPPDRQDDFAHMREVILRGDSLIHYETVRKRKDGILVPVSLTVSPVRDAAGNITGLSKIARDLTEQKHAELMANQLRQAQKIEAVGRLAGGVAHDFNNMLMVIMNYTELLQNSLTPGDERRRNTQEVLKAGKRAALVASQLLAFSRRQILRPEVLELKDLVRDMLAMLRRLIGEDIRLTFRSTDATTRVLIDPGQASQILLNLCVNSRDAMPKGGDLTIEVGDVYLDEQYQAKHNQVRTGWYVMLAITDTGTGIPADIRDKIFEPFFTTKPIDKGTGLGLATVYGIVKQSNGWIWLYSEPDRGTTFKIYLPKLDKNAVPETAISDVDTDSIQSAEVILLIEDEEALRTSIQSYLESIGYTVISAGDGEEAIRKATASNGRFDIVITDVIMPKMSGREAVERLKAIRPELKALFMSGYTEETISHHGILDPGVTYLQKPFAFMTLAKTLRQLSQKSG